MIVYVSHSAGGPESEWFVVHPPGARTLSEEVESLEAAGRKVFAVEVSNDEEFFRGYAGALNDLRGAIDAGLAGDPVELLTWIAKVRRKFQLPPDDLDADARALHARLTDSGDERARLVELGVPEDGVDELLSIAHRAGRAAP